MLIIGIRTLMKCAVPRLLLPVKCGVLKGTQVQLLTALPVPSLNGFIEIVKGTWPVRE